MARLLALLLSGLLHLTIVADVLDPRFDWCSPHYAQSSPGDSLNAFPKSIPSLSTMYVALMSPLNSKCDLGWHNTRQIIQGSWCIPLRQIHKYVSFRIIQGGAGRVAMRMDRARRVDQ